MPSSAPAHDPSAWGGLFRSGDGGATWRPLSSGSFVSGALALAVSPRDPRELLLATESGLLHSQNGGREWAVEAAHVLFGPMFAAAYDQEGRGALVSAASAIYRRDPTGWHPISAPAGSVPARALVAGATPGRVYLTGDAGVFRSDDWGTAWTRGGDGLPEAPATALAVAPGPPEIVYAIAGGQLWAAVGGTWRWQPRDAGLPSGRIEALALPRDDPGRVWVVAAGQVFRSDARVERWEPIGGPLPERDTAVRGIAVAGPMIVVSTDRGLYRHREARWELVDEGVPAHLEAGPLVQDLATPSTLYAGFALTPYEALRRQAADGASPLGRLSMASLAGGAAFLGLLGLSALTALRWVTRTYYREARHAPSDRRRARAAPPGDTPR